MHQDDQKNNKHDFGYKVGYNCGSILITCAMAVVIALTAKFILWLL